MPDIIVPEDRIREIKLEDLLENAQYMKHNGMRLAQACAAFINGQYELSYSFVDSSSYAMITLRVICGLEDEVPSLGEFYPYAVFYENEMEALFGVHMRMMNLDYHTKFYRIKKWAAMLPEDARQEKVAMKKEKSVVPGATQQPDAADEQERIVIENKAVPLKKSAMASMAETKPEATPVEKISDAPKETAGAAGEGKKEGGQ